MIKFRAVALCMSATLLLAAPCRAGDVAGKDDAESHWDGYVSLGAGLLPDYDGSKYYEILPYVEGRLNYDNYYVRFEGAALRFNIVDDENFHAGPLMGFRRGRGATDSIAVSHLAQLDDTETAGGFIEWEHVADDPRSGESVTLTADDAMTDAPSGLAVVLRATIRRPVLDIDPGLIVSLEGDASWSSRQFMQTYFGVTPSEAAASGLPAFTARDGFSQVGVALSLDQFVSRHWGFGVRMHYGRYFDAAADSPVVSIAGSPDQYFLGVVVGYVL